jgi:hypothetical protein
MQETSKRRFYILTGDQETWNTSLQYKIWGFSERTRVLWNKSSTGDFAAFYVTSPVSKIIGFGKLTRKFIDEELTWPDEKLFKTPIWKYRIRFDILCLIDNWTNGISVPEHIMLNTGRKVVDKDTFSFILKRANKKWQKKLSLEEIA